MSLPNSALRIPLTVNEEQTKRLAALQHLFAEVCNAISPVAHKNRCWNRVALHHLVYRGIREKYAQLGSQMVCNAVYSVCRIYRLVYENPNSPFNISIKVGGELPLVKFLDTNPVYFDRHTLSIKDQVLSMFTLDGRMHFQINLDAQSLKRFQEEKLREITLVGDKKAYELIFNFANADSVNKKVIDLQWPNYVVVHESSATNHSEPQSVSQEQTNTNRSHYVL
jgi:hypothetical protein